MKQLFRTILLTLLAFLLINLIILQDDSANTRWEEKEQQYTVQITDRPTDIPTALYTYKVLGLKLEINGDYVKYPPNHIDVDSAFAYSKGFYLMFNTEKSCNGEFTLNRITLYLWDGNIWVPYQVITLEDVSFNSQPGTHDFYIEGSTIRLIYTHNYDCWSTSAYIEIR